MIIVGASALSQDSWFSKFRKIADEVGAVLWRISPYRGACLYGMHPSPVPVCEYVTSTTHKTLRGPRGGLIMCKEAYAKTLNSRVFPACRRAFNACYCRQGRCFSRSASAGIQGISKQIIKNAQAMSDELKNQGFRIVSGGTDNHLMLVDLTAKGVTGKKAHKASTRAILSIKRIPLILRDPGNQWNQNRPLLDNKKAWRKARCVNRFLYRRCN